MQVMLFFYLLGYAETAASDYISFNFPPPFDCEMRSDGADKIDGLQVGIKFNPPHIDNNHVYSR